MKHLHQDRKDGIVNRYIIVKDLNMFAVYDTYQDRVCTGYAKRWELVKRWLDDFNSGRRP